MISIFNNMKNKLKHNPNDLNEAIDLIVKFGQTFYCVLFDSIEDYMNNKKTSRRKQIIGLLLNLNLWINGIRFLVISLVDNIYVKVIFADLFHSFVRSDTNGFMLSLLCFSAASIGMFTNV